MSHIDWFKSCIRLELTEVLGFPVREFLRKAVGQHTRLVVLEAYRQNGPKPMDFRSLLMDAAVTMPWHEFLIVIPPFSEWSNAVTVNARGSVATLPNVRIGLRANTQVEADSSAAIAEASVVYGWQKPALILDPIEHLLLSPKQAHRFAGVMIRYQAGAPDPNPLIRDLEIDLAMDTVPYAIEHNPHRYSDGKFYSIFDKDSK